MNGFTIYREYYELITLLSEKEQQELLLAIIKYMFDDIDPILNDKQTKIFNNLKRPLEKSKKRSQCGSNKNQNEIKLKTNENQNEIKLKTHQDVNVNVNDYVIDINTNDIKNIIDYLNEKTNSNYKSTTSKTKNLIIARFNEGFNINDFKKVIDNKTKEWSKDEKMNKYLRPETLFGTKFESYLNQKELVSTPNWFNENNIDVKASDKEKEEMELLLQEFKEE